MIGHHSNTLRPPRGVCEACLHQVHKPRASGAIPSQTCGNVHVAVHPHRVLVEMLQWHKVCEIGADELTRPPVVALKNAFWSLSWNWKMSWNWAIFYVFNFISSTKRHFSNVDTLLVSMATYRNRKQQTYLFLVSFEYKLLVHTYSVNNGVLSFIKHLKLFLQDHVLNTVR